MAGPGRRRSTRRVLANKRKTVCVVGKERRGEERVLEKLG